MHPSTASSSQVEDMNSTRGFGELGQTKSRKDFKPNSMWIDDERDDLSSDEEQQLKESDKITCPNCNKVMTVNEAPAHTV